MRVNQITQGSKRSFIKENKMKASQAKSIRVGGSSYDGYSNDYKFHNNFMEGSSAHEEKKQSTKLKISKLTARNLKNFSNHFQNTSQLSNRSS